MTKQIIDSYPIDLVSPVDWSDESQNINDRVRSYLDVNCGHCHSPTGNANSTGLYLHLDETRDIHLGVYKKPVATGRGSGGLKYSIVPGKPEESILLHRMISLDPGVMMPESGRAMSHEEAVEMVREWILLLKESVDIALLPPVPNLLLICWSTPGGGGYIFADIKLGGSAQLSPVSA